MTLIEISKVIIESNKIGITFHTSPDGDAIGSALGLLNGLREIGKNAYIISREVIPDNLSFLPLGCEIDGKIKAPIYGTDLVIVLDCGNVDRICANLDQYDCTVMNIDHHITNEKYGEYNYVDDKAAATAELIYLLLKELKFVFDEKAGSVEKIGTCIYTGLVTDTGSFRHANVTKRTHSIAGELISCGVNNTKIHNNLFDNKPFNKVKLMGTALSNLELLCGGKVSYIEISMKTLEEFKLSHVDTSDIISIALSIENVEVAVVVKEVEDGVKASLRSKDKFDVRHIAEALGGGGHIKAAGLKLTGNSLHQAKAKIINEIEKEM
jgi:phosphoesterase RecJ-like protein